jgi:hypothetical protein
VRRTVYLRCHKSDGRKERRRLTRRVAPEKTACVRIRSWQGRRAVAAVTDRWILGDKPLINEMRRVQARGQRLQDEAKHERGDNGSSARPCVANGHG